MNKMNGDLSTQMIYDHQYIIDEKYYYYLYLHSGNDDFLFL